MGLEPLWPPHRRTYLHALHSGVAGSSQNPTMRSWSEPPSLLLSWSRTGTRTLGSRQSTDRDSEQSESSWPALLSNQHKALCLGAVPGCFPAVSDKPLCSGGPLVIPARLEPKHSKQRHEISSSDRKIHFKRTLVLMKQHFSLEKESIFNLWQSNKTQHISFLQMKMF